MAKRKEMKNVTIGPVAKQESSSSPNVKFVRSELVRLQPAYCMIRDCIEGELAVKGILQNGPEALVEDSKGLTYNGMGSQSYLPNVQRAKRYLPQPNPEDQSQENINRYVSYVQRAVFYNVTGRTLEGLAGQIFLRDPIFEIPEMLQSLLKDADGKGVALHQLAKRAVRWVLAYGRCGLHVDYPSVDRATVKQLKDGQISPIVTVYEPWNVINWRTVELNGKRVLSLVVLREFVEDETDQFETKLVEQYRILRLDVNTGTHTVEVYSKDGDTLKSRGVFEPKDGDGKPLVGIPFCFVGSEANDAIPDNPPLYDLATLNIAHYRNSADYEEACYLMGQPTPVMMGLTQEWVDNVLKGKVMFGSRQCIPLPPNSDAKLLQAQANTMVKEAMDQKDAEMVAIGAKLVQKNRTTRPTATEVVVETTSESSVLTNVAKNVSAAFEWALGIAASYVKATGEVIKYQLNTDFDLSKLSPEGQASVIKSWQSGAIAFTEMRDQLRKSGIATLPDADAKNEISKDQQDMIAAELALNGGNDNNGAASNGKE